MRLKNGSASEIVMHELVSDDLHIDVFPIPPSATKELIVSYSAERQNAADPFRIYLRGLPKLSKLSIRAIVAKNQDGGLTSSLGGKSLAHHGFKKILLVNGHGSNVPFLDIAARNITNHTPSICAMVPWWNLLPKDLIRAHRESAYPGGMAHGCELETSLLMYLRGDLVQMQHAEPDFPVQRSEYFYWDLERPSPVFFQEFFSRYSRTGTLGDPTKATVEKGRIFTEVCIEKLIEVIRELRTRQIEPRVDHH